MPRDQFDQLRRGIRGLHVLAGRDVRFDQPFDRDVAAPGGIVVRHVAGDVGQLEGEPEVAGAVERVVIVGAHAHDLRHHHPDRAGDVDSNSASCRPRCAGASPAASSAKPSITSSAIVLGQAGIRPRPGRSASNASSAVGWPSQRARGQHADRLTRRCASIASSSLRTARRRGPARRRCRRSGGTRHRAARPARASPCRTAGWPAAKLLLPRAIDFRAWRTSAARSRPPPTCRGVCRRMLEDEPALPNRRMRAASRGPRPSSGRSACAARYAAIRVEQRGRVRLRR